MARISISVPDDLKNRMDAVEEWMNWSDIARTAFETALASRNSLDALKLKSSVDFRRYGAPTLDLKNTFIVMDGIPISVEALLKKLVAHTIKENCV